VKHIISFLLLVSTIVSAKVIPYIPYRSQSENAARELVLWQTQINRCCMETNYGSFTFTPEYTRTYQLDSIAQSLFCTALQHDCCEEICPHFSVQGSMVSGRDNNSFLADYFGLPTDYNSMVYLEPRLENFIADLDYYIGLDRWLQGLYFRIHVPIVHTIAGLNVSESITTTGNANYLTGYFNDAILGTAPSNYGVKRSNLSRTFKSFVSCHEVPLIDGIIFQPLEKARFSSCSRRKSGVSDLQMALGWNFLTGDKYHFGINLRGAVPTGNRPEACWLFEPIVGNGKHGELGIGLTTHCSCWRNKKTNEDFSIYLDANLTHMFKARQCRTFDLTCKPLSRYMLAEKMTTPSSDLVDEDGNAPQYQFANEFAPVANLSTIQVDVSAAIQADVVLKFAYTSKNFQFDVGYEFWGRSCEKICPRLDCCATETGTWALKGDAFVYGFPGTGGVRSGSSIALSATEADATIFCGSSNAQRANISWQRNPGVDNPKLAFTDIVGSPVVYNIIGATNQQMYSSFAPTVFSTGSTEHLAIADAQSRGISHKLFCNFGYLWQQRQVWVPFLGVGVEVEIGRHDKQLSTAQQCICPTKNPTGTTATSCGCNETIPANCCCPLPREKCCSDCALSQWGVWVKGGITYH
jgi:hypothetical protein